MSRKWFSIAKAEYLISTASIRGNRSRSMGALFIFGIIWAILLAPYIIRIIFSMIVPIEHLRLILTIFLPGIMRSVMFFLWMMLLILPLSRALQELRIGQWEIFLANNVRTRDILIGTFLGKIPIYSILTLYLAPLFLPILFQVFEVTILGQILIYFIVFAMILATIWLSNLITAAIQAKLGESARGKDIANGLAILLAIISIIPIYGIMFFSQQLSVFLGLNFFLLFPFTWPADIISWLTIFFRQVNLSFEEIVLLQSILQLDIFSSTTFFIVFVLACVGFGLFAADRIFTYNIGARTEQITTIKGENVFYRGIRKMTSGSFGVLLVTSMKDFFRKASNLSKIAYGIILAVVLPFLVTVFGDIGDLDTMMLILVGGVGMALIGSFTFGGSAFMESKDQLWIIQSTPSGTTRYVKARVISAFIIAIPLCIIPSIVMTYIGGAGFDTLIFLLFYGYSVICGAILFSTGVTAANPYYENTKSPEHQMNVIITTMGAQFALFAPIAISIFGDIFGLHFWDLILDTVGMTGLPYAFALISVITLFIVGGLTLIIGTKRLARPEI